VQHLDSLHSDVADEYTVLRVATEDVDRFCSTHHSVTTALTHSSGNSSDTSSDPTHHSVTTALTHSSDTSSDTSSDPTHHSVTTALTHSSDPKHHSDTTTALTHSNELECNNNNTIYIHLGVSALSKVVCLEQCAYNNMTFRVPDEGGYQPLHQCIDCASEFDTTLQSDLPLHSISTQVSSECGSEVVTVSRDPGRYLCNYIYYRTLSHCVKSGQVKQCVFIHVPTVTDMPLLTQIDVVSRCVRLIRKSCE
jgi:pyroglutamyl-peptidase